jgi:hypothetical protein
MYYMSIASSVISTPDETYFCFLLGICVAFVKIATNTFIVYIDRQDPPWLFRERAPENLDEAYKDVNIGARGFGWETLKCEPDEIRTAQHHAESFRVNKRQWDKRKLCRNPCFVDDFFFDRITPDSQVGTTEEADDYTHTLLHAMCDQTKAIERRKLVNMPKCWGKEMQEYVTEGFRVLSKSELEPVQTLDRLQLWLEWDQVNIQFDTWQLLQFCSEILTDVLEKVRDHPKLGERARDGRFDKAPMEMVALIIAYAAGEEDVWPSRPGRPNPGLQQMKRI